MDSLRLRFTPDLGYEWRSLPQRCTTRRLGVSCKLKIKNKGLLESIQELLESIEELIEFIEKLWLSLAPVAATGACGCR